MFQFERQMRLLAISHVKSKLKLATGLSTSTTFFIHSDGLQHINHGFFPLHRPSQLKAIDIIIMSTLNETTSQSTNDNRLNDTI